MNEEPEPAKPRPLPVFITTAGHGSRVHPRFEGLLPSEILKILQTEDDRAYLIRSGWPPELLAPYPDDPDASAD